MHGYFRDHENTMPRVSEIYHDVHPSFGGYREHAPLSATERLILREEQLLHQMAMAEREGMFDYHDYYRTNEEMQDAVLLRQHQQYLNSLHH